MIKRNVDPGGRHEVSASDDFQRRWTRHPTGLGSTGRSHNYGYEPGDVRRVSASPRDRAMTRGLCRSVEARGGFLILPRHLAMLTTLVVSEKRPDRLRYRTRETSSGTLMTRRLEAELHPELRRQVQKSGTS